jgi:inner membrane protein
MTFGTHVLGALILSSFLNLPVIPAVLGSVIPDIDHGKGLPPPKKRTLLNSHRGMTHHLAIPLALFLISLTVKDFLNERAGIDLLSFSAGYFSHLILDALTPLGIPYKFSYYPRFSLKLLKTGKLGEIFVILIFVIALIFEVKRGELRLNLFKI